MADELPTFESMFRKSKGLDLAEEAPSEEEDTPAEIQRSRVSDKLTDEDGNSRLKHKANVPSLENYDQDIRAPQGEVHDADKLKATRKSAGIREMIARECFEKTGRIPDVEFMDTYEVKKAYSSMAYGDYNGSPDIAPPAKYPTDEFDEESEFEDVEPIYNEEPLGDDMGEEEEDAIDVDSRDPTSPKTPTLYRDYYKNPADLESILDIEAWLSKIRKEKRAEEAKLMRPPDNRVQTKLEAFAPGGTGLMRRQIKKADTSDASEGDISFRAMLAYRTFQKTGRTPDVDFFESDYFQKAAVETDINDLQGAASTEPIRGYRGETVDERVDDFENSPQFANERKKIADRVSSVSPEKLNPGYEKMIGTTGYLETPGDVGASLAEGVKQDAISDGDVPDTYHSFMRGPHSKAIVGKMKSHGFSDEEIQSTLRQILEGYDNPREYQDY